MDEKTASIEEEVEGNSRTESESYYCLTVSPREILFFGWPIEELARRIGVSRQAVRKRVGEIAGLDFATLHADPSNRSAKLVTLSETGQANIDSAIDVFEDIEDEPAS